MYSIKKESVAGLGLFFLSSVVFAESYQQEISLSYSASDSEYSSGTTSRGESETDTYSGRYQYYWSPVNTKNVPLAEADFMARAAGLDLEVTHYSGSNVRYGALPGRSNFSGDFFYLNADYAVSKDMLLGVAYQYSDFEFGSSSSKDQGIALEAGYYIGEFTMLGLMIARDREEDDQDGRSYSSFHGLLVKSVLELSGKKFLALEAFLLGTDSVPEDESKRLSLEAIFYFSTNTGIGGRYFHTFDEGADVLATDSYSLNISHFFTKELSVSLSATRWENNDSDLNYESDEFSIELAKRF